MSAWIVSKAHIDTLVQAGLQWEVADVDALDALGADLWQECHNSVNDRYGEAEPVPDYAFAGSVCTLAPVAVLKQVACYEYQSCEHAGWDTSAAAAYCEKLTAAIEATLDPALLRLVPQYGSQAKAYRASDAWEHAPWGVDESPAEVGE